MRAETLRAARIVYRLGMAHGIRFLVGREHVGASFESIAQGMRGRVAMAFARKGRKGAPGPDAVALGQDACADACALYAVAVHARNRKLYGRGMSGRVR